MQTKKITYIALFFFCNFSWGQFNTLSPQVKEEKSKYEIVELKKEENKDSKLRKNSFWKIFSSEKKALKKEIDSLKQVINNKTDTQKINTKHLEDSIITSIAKKIININKEVEEKKTDVEAKKLKIAMPISGDLQVTSAFGMRLHPILNRTEMHNGIDLRANYQFVYAVLEGVVSSVGWDSKGGGVFMKVQHSNGLETSYLHLSEVYYKEGDTVKAGFIIGKSGNTGLSTAPHLHFAVKENDKYINPVHFLRDLVEISNLKF